MEYPIKKELLEKAVYHYECSEKIVSLLQNDKWWEPDLDNEKHVHALIGSGVSALSLPGIRQKLVALVVGLVSSLTVDSYQRRQYFVGYLNDLSYHLEMYDFFNNAYLHANEVLIVDSDFPTKRCYDCLERIVRTEIELKMIPEQDIRDAALSKIVKLKKELLGYLTPDAKMFGIRFSEFAHDIYKDVFILCQNTCNPWIGNKAIMLLYSVHYDIEKVAIYWSTLAIEEKKRANALQEIFVENEAT